MCDVGRGGAYSPAMTTAEDDAVPAAPAHRSPVQKARARLRARGRRFVRSTMAPDLAAATAPDPSVSARHVPLDTDADGYWSVPAFTPRGFDPSVVPPAELRRVGQGFLEDGKQHVEHMRANLLRYGCDVREAGGILDLGCGVGRMIRWLVDLADDQPIWGVDIEVAAIRWAQEHMTPPFHFTTGTTAPHLPFEDRTFGLIYAGSVFSHIEELADAWLLELRRVTKPGGFLYLTVHDRSSIHEWLTNVPHDPMSVQMRARPDLFDRLGDEHAAIGHRPWGNVFYDIGYLTWLWGDWLDVLGVIEGAWNNQAAMVLRRPPA